MFLFYVMIPIEGKSVMCLREKEDPETGSRPEDSGFELGHFCMVSCAYSIWIRVENIKQTGEIGKLYEELIKYIESNPAKDEEIQKEIDEYVIAVLKNLGLTDCKPCGIRVKQMKILFELFKKMNDQKIPFPREPCKKKRIRPDTTRRCLLLLY